MELFGETGGEWSNGLCSARDWQELGLQEVWNRVEPWSPYGKQAKAAFVAFKPGQEQHWQQAMELTWHLQKRLAAQPESLPELSRLFSELPQLANLLELVEAGQVLDDTYLYSVKKFLYLAERLGELLTAFGGEKVRRQVLEPSGLFGLSPIREKFFSAGELGCHFYLEDRYSPELAELRSGLLKLTTRLNHLALEATAQAALDLGCAITWDGPLVVDREDRELMESLEKHASFVPVEENIFAVTWRRRPTEAETKLIGDIELLWEKVQLMEARVRQDLWKLVGQWRGNLQEVGKWLGCLDFHLAKARLAAQISGVPPKLGNGLVIRQGVNFLLAEKLKCQGRAYVPLDMEIARGVTIITGANMGGKTVTLQTVGLLVGMAHLGLPVPAGEVVLQLEEFLHSNLGMTCTPGFSSFGTEIKSLVEVFPLIKGGGILLLDEPARSTNPEEGYALVAALVEYFQVRPVRVVLTTHFPGLTSWEGVGHYRVKGLLQKEKLTQGQGIWQVFDYRLEKMEQRDDSDSGDALQVAGWMGLPEEIIDRAQFIYQANRKPWGARLAGLAVSGRAGLPRGGGLNGEIEVKSGIGETMPESSRENSTGEPELY